MTERIELTDWLVRRGERSTRKFYASVQTDTKFDIYITIFDKTLWTLQSKNRATDYWGNIMLAVPFAEVQQHVDTLLAGYRAVGRQHYFRAYCINDDIDDVELASAAGLPGVQRVDHGGRSCPDDGRHDMVSNLAHKRKLRRLRKQELRYKQRIAQIQWSVLDMVTPQFPDSYKVFFDERGQPVIEKWDSMGTLLLCSEAERITLVKRAGGYSNGHANGRVYA